MCVLYGHLINLSDPAASQPGRNQTVDLNWGSEEMVRSPGVLWPANGIADGVGGTLSVDSTRQTVRTNAVMAPKLLYLHGNKQEGGEEPVDKNQIRPGDGRWAGRRGVGRSDPRREIKIKGKKEDKGRRTRKKITNRRKLLARKRRRRGRVERRLLRQSERRNRARTRG